MAEAVKNMQAEEPRALRRLREAAEHYPEFWREIDRTRDNARKMGVVWPEWC